MRMCAYISNHRFVIFTNINQGLQQTATFTSKMGEHYEMKFQNATDQPWHFAVYQKFPTSPGLSSVAWQVRGLPPQKIGSPAPSATVSWTMNYGVCIADFDTDGQKFTGDQFAPANLGNEYQVTSSDGIPDIQSTAYGSTTSDQIVLKNNTSNPVKPVTMGFTVSNNLICAEQDVGGKQSTIFRVHPSYYVACYRNIQLGQLVDEGVTIGPLPVEYTGGVHKHTVQAYKDPSGNYFLKPVA